MLSFTYPQPFSRQPQSHVPGAVISNTKNLCSHNTSPSILEHLKRATSNLTDPSQPPTKRAKLSTSSTIESIAVKVQKKTYSSIEEFVSDVEKVCSEALQSTRPKGSNVDGGTQWRYVSDSLEQDRIVANLATFKKVLNSLVIREKQQIKAEPKSNGHVDRNASKTEPDSDGTVRDGGSSSLTNDTRDGRTVLTLFGNAQGHKQLFSSFQKSIPKVRVTQYEQDVSFEIGSSELAVMPIRENGLPNGISSTKIIPLHVDDASAGRTPGPTFLESFAPPATLPALSPPKTPQIATARGSTITWTKSGVIQDSAKRSGYANERLPAGHWLGYNGLAITEEPSSPEAKRKQRDRALSTGDAGLLPTEGAKAAQLQSKEDALFRGVYSSFAPCRDDTSAIFPEEVKSQAWWHKTGERCFEEAFAVNPALLGHEVGGAGRLENTDDEEEALFREAIEAFVPLAEIPGFESDPVPNEDKDGSQILREISDMLEVLHSHQRIRNSAVATNSRASTSQNPSKGDVTVTASTPSAAEIDTYNNLKAQFSIIISLLPPYAIAKLNGQQLADLNISQHVLLDERDYRGAMEEDQAARLAKATALDAAVGASTAPRPMSTNTPSQGQYTVPQPRTAQMTQPSRTPAQQFYQPQASSARPSSYSRQPLSSWQSPAQARQSSMQRPSYPQQNSYSSLSQQTPKPMYAQVPRVPPASAPLSSYLPPTPGNFHQPNGMYQSISLPGYQQHAQNYGNYNPNGSYPQNASSPKPATYDNSQYQSQYVQPSSLPAYQSPHPPPTALMQSHSRPLYLPQPTPPLPVPSTLPYNPNNPYPPNPIPANYAINTSNPTVNASASITSRSQTPSTPAAQQGPLSSAGLHLAMTSDQQQATMDRQSVQLAEQRRVSVGSAPGSIARSVSGTPQPLVQR